MRDVLEFSGEKPGQVGSVAPADVRRSTVICWTLYAVIRNRSPRRPIAASPAPTCRAFTGAAVVVQREVCGVDGVYDVEPRVNADDLNLSPDRQAKLRDIARDRVARATATIDDGVRILRLNSQDRSGNPISRERAGARRMMMLFPENVNVVAVGFGVSVEDSVSSRPALPVELAPTSGAECHQMADGCEPRFWPGSKI